MDVAHLHAVAFLEQDVKPGMPAAEEAQEERALVAVRSRVGWRERHGYGSSESSVRGAGPAVIWKKS
jgi:hypothetical protein